MPKALPFCAAALLIFISSSASVYVAQAQENSFASSVALPDAPGLVLASSGGDSDAATLPQNPPPPQSSTPSSTPSEDQQLHQTKRILGIVPNFRAVSANQTLPPQSAKEKFITATEDSFDYSSIVLPAVVAGYSMATDQTPEFHQGGIGFSRYLWHSVVDQTVENYMVEFVVPSITREDTRYYTLGKGGFKKRAGYALSRAVVTRSDSGKETFNFGEILGAGGAAGISNLYYPSPERTFGNTAQKWGLNVGIDAATFFFKEFWPEINRTVFHNHG
ncbi:MAG TPA: hypothetical protein VHZ52_02175 [Acidobacteriaceae bacterium]|nr:hypothetical protein [Acidobacteriaceae bacterium]